MAYSIAGSSPLASDSKNNIGAATTVPNPVFQTSFFFAALVVLLALALPVSAEAGNRPDVSGADSFFSHSLVSVIPKPTGTDRDQLKNRVNTLESRSAYDRVDQSTQISPLEDNALSSAYLDLALDLAESGEHGKALDLYNQALQSVRSNDGIHSPDQLPILRAQLVTLEELELWSKFNDTAYQIYDISRRNFKPGADDRISALEILGKWKLKSVNEGLLRETDAQIQLVETLYDKELSEVEASVEETMSSSGFVSLVMGKAIAKLSVVKKVLDRPLSLYRSSVGDQTLSTGIPNLNYYQAPARMKDREVSVYLEDLRVAILDAGQVLESAGPLENRELLVNDFRFLAESYTNVSNMAGTH